MMVTAQGADHTAGNLPTFECKGKTVAELVEASYDIQVYSAVADSTGLCVFGRSVTNANLDLIANAINDAHDTRIDPEFILNIGRETLRLEHEFNIAAGFTDDDDELPAFFREESLAPTNKMARLHSGEVNRHMREIEKRFPN
jgi:aldehyde:ferredoxin oxidoreductase